MQKVPKALGREKLGTIIKILLIIGLKQFLSPNPTEFTAFSANLIVSVIARHEAIYKFYSTIFE